MSPQVVPIVRIEDAEGNGPFTSRDDYAPPGLDAGRLPMPCEEGLAAPRGTFIDPRFGFLGEARTHNPFYWFTARDRENLRPFGYVLAHYVAPTDCVKVGDTQLVFDRAKATKVREESI